MVNAELAAQSIADGWVARVQRDLRVANRALAGGWPGTMREARAVTHAHFYATREQHGALEAEELERIARMTYERARKRWLSSAATESESDA